MAASEPEPTPEHGPETAAAEPIDSRSVLLTCVSLLASKAWEAMGLVPDPVTKKIEVNLPEAQLAIDGAAALVEIVKGKLSDADRREVETLLMNLRINFVERTGKSPEGA